MEKIGSSAPVSINHRQITHTVKTVFTKIMVYYNFFVHICVCLQSLSGKKPSLYLKLDSVTDSPKKSSSMQDSEPNSPCTG